MTITVSELWIGARLGSLATMAVAIGLLWAVARAQRARKGKGRE